MDTGFLSLQLCEQTCRHLSYFGQRTLYITILPGFFFGSTFLRWQQILRSGDVFNFLAKKIPSPTGARIGVIGALNGITTEVVSASKLEMLMKIWTELVQRLDELSIRIFKFEFQSDSLEAWKRLQAHFSSSETSRVMILLQQLTSRSLKPGEEMTDYLIKSVRLSSSLEVADEKISGKLLILWFLNVYLIVPKYFKTVHSFSVIPIPFSDIKNSLKNFAHKQKLKEAGSQEDLSLKLRCLCLRRARRDFW